MNTSVRIAEDAALLVEMCRRHYSGTYRAYCEWPPEGLWFVGYRFSFHDHRWHVQIGRVTWTITHTQLNHALERLQWLEYSYKL